MALRREPVSVEFWWHEGVVEHFQVNTRVFLEDPMYLDEPRRRDYPKQRADFTPAILAFIDELETKMIAFVKAEEAMSDGS